ncbi:MAG: elongation factor P [Planctomycetes bacterium]|nr:elongation factor P [Planctomycetota bacterium]
MATYNTSQFKKGLKVQIDGEPYLMIECNFVKPGKGNALYKCKLRNLLRGSQLERTWKGGDTLESADIEETNGQFLYRAGENFVFMDTRSYDQYELTPEQVDDNWKYLKDEMTVDLVLYNGVPIALTLPNHVELEVIECEPAVKGDTATSVTKGAKVQTGGEVQVPSFVKVGDVLKIDTRTGEYIERVNK